MQAKAANIARTTCLIVLFIIVFQPVSLSQSQFWQQTNGPYYLPCNIIIGGGQKPLYATASSTIGGGIYKSTDKGNSWRKIDSSIATYHVRSMCLNSKGHIFVASDANAYRSTDEGENWTSIFLGSGINCITVDTNDQVFAGAGGIFRSTDNGDSWLPAGLSQFEVYFVYSIEQSRLLAMTGYGMQLSTDNGDHWSHTGVSNPMAYSFAKDRKGVLFAALSDSGVYRSTDSGATWEQVNVGLKSLDIRSTAITPGGVLIAGSFGGGMYSSLNEGEEWTQNSADIESPFFNVVHVESDSVFLAGTMTGVFSSSNSGKQWHRVTVGTTSSLTEVHALNVSLPGTTLAGATGGVYSSTNRGLGWNQVGIPVTAVLTIARGKNGDLYAGTASYGVFRSTDSARTWLQTGLKDSTIQSIVIDSEGRIYAGARTLMLSIDNGATWSTLGIRRATIYDMTITKNGTILVATDSLGLHRSTDDGSTWNIVNTLWQVCRTVGMNTNGDIYTEVEGFAGNHRSVYRSTDEGSTWTTCGALNGTVLCFAFNSAGDIFAGTDSNGVFRSTDNGSSWNNISSGLTSERVYSLAVDERSFLYAGTAMGAFTSNEPTTGVSTDNLGDRYTFMLSQNYPNPFNPATVISYQLPVISKVTLKIYDVLGREVATLVKEWEPAGAYTVTFDAAHLSSGIYICKLQAGTYSAATKMVLMK